jgi:hypothetical protein
MAPDIPKIDPDRSPDPGASAWYFRDEVLRMLFHPHSLSLFRKTFSSHFSETTCCCTDLDEPNAIGATCRSIREVRKTNSPI